MAAPAVRTLRFQHWLERQAGYEALLLTDRKLLHGEVASAWESGLFPEHSGPLSAAELTERFVQGIPGDPALSSDSQTIALHWLLAGNRQRSGIFLLATAGVMEERGDFRAACMAAESALERLPRPDADVARAHSHVLQSRCLTWMGRHAEAEAALVDAEAAVLDATPAGRLVRARIATVRGVAALHTSDLDRAEAMLEEAARLSKAGAFHQQTASVLNSLAHLRMIRGDPGASLALLEEALGIYSLNRFLRSGALCVGNMGIVLDALGRSADARERFEQALAMQREAGDRNGEAVTLSNLGTSLTRLGMLHAARTVLLDSAALAARTDDPGTEGAALATLTGVLVELGEADEALQRARRSESLLRGAHERRELSSALIAVSTSLRALSRLDEAARVLDEGLRIADSSEAFEQLIGLRVDLAELRLEQGRPEDAAREAEQALADAKSRSHADLEICALECLALARGDASLADQGAALSRRIGYRLAEGHALAAVAEILAGAGGGAASREAAAAAAKIATETGSLRLSRRLARLPVIAKVQIA